ncbi:hypothetical protein LWI29_027919 [Acer saccharum]|uniref:Uncharacterized protein n=1 Tax=Acer saccharum TaxID=4024 RepID=A0AA39SP36_ACESA|nr:hypothetical protein LWI29_027919 [Acer saccharum]
MEIGLRTADDDEPSQLLVPVPVLVLVLVPVPVPVPSVDYQQSSDPVSSNDDQPSLSLPRANHNKASLPVPVPHIKMIVKFVYHYKNIVQDLVVIDNQCIFDDREGTIPHQFVRLPLPQPYQYKHPVPLCKGGPLYTCIQIFPNCSYKSNHHTGRQYVPCIAFIDIWCTM